MTLPYIAFWLLRTIIPRIDSTTLASVRYLWRRFPSIVIGERYSPRGIIVGFQSNTLRPRKLLRSCSSALHAVNTSCGQLACSGLPGSTPPYPSHQLPLERTSGKPASRRLCSEPEIAREDGALAGQREVGGRVRARGRLRRSVGKRAPEAA